MQIKGFPFIELDYLSGSIELSPDPLAVTGLSMEVQGRIVHTDITTTLVSKAVPPCCKASHSTCAGTRAQHMCGDGAQHMCGDSALCP